MGKKSNKRHECNKHRTHNNLCHSYCILLNFKIAPIHYKVLKRQNTHTHTYQRRQDIAFVHLFETIHSEELVPLFTPSAFELILLYAFFYAGKCTRFEWKFSVGCFLLSLSCTRSTSMAYFNGCWEIRVTGSIISNDGNDKTTPSPPPLLPLHTPTHTTHWKSQVWWQCKGTISEFLKCTKALRMIHESCKKDPSDRILKDMIQRTNSNYSLITVGEKSVLSSGWIQHTHTG